MGQDTNYLSRLKIEPPGICRRVLPHKPTVTILAALSLSVMLSCAQPDPCDFLQEVPAIMGNCDTVITCTDGGRATTVTCDGMSYLIHVPCEMNGGYLIPIYEKCTTTFIDGNERSDEGDF